MGRCASKVYQAAIIRLSNQTLALFLEEFFSNTTEHILIWTQRLNIAANRSVFLWRCVELAKVIVSSGSRCPSTAHRICLARQGNP